jgi:hypothetical protein
LLSWRLKIAPPGLRTVNLLIGVHVCGSDLFNIPVLYVRWPQD